MHLLRTLLLVGTAALAVQAQSAKSEPGHFFLNMGLTVGGDTLATVAYTDGTTSSLKAGGSIQFKAGGDFRIQPKVDLQFSIGYHMDSTREARNGTLTFTRMPLEGLVFYHYQPNMRVGAGLRKAMSAKLDGSGLAASVGSYDFDSSLGFILEWEYLFGRSHFGRGGFSVRYVSESYTPSGYPGAASIDGSHVGAGFSWYF
jgi:hypothetical protein